MANSSPYDPAALAASVRSVALEAQRILQDPAARPFEIRALWRQITFIQRQVPSSESSDLSRWLESLLKKVEAAYQPERPARASRPRVKRAVAQRSRFNWRVLLR